MPAPLTWSVGGGGAEALGTLLAVPYTFPAASYALTVTDELGAGRTVTINPTAAARVYRTFLAYTGGGSPGTNSGTEADPDELLAHLATQLNAGAVGTIWTVTLSDPQRLVQFTYLGTGTGTVAFPSDKTLQNLLGWTVGTTGALATGAALAGAYQPMMCCFALCRSRDTGWIHVPQKFAGAELADGSVYGWGDAQNRAVRSWDQRFHPPGGALAGLAHATPPGALATPMYPALTTALKSPTRSTAGLSAFQTMLPWSVWETLATIAGVRVGLAPGNLAALVAGSDTLFDDVYLSLATINATDAVVQSTPGWGGRWDWKGVRVWFFEQMTR